MSSEIQRAITQREASLEGCRRQIAVLEDELAALYKVRGMLPTAPKSILSGDEIPDGITVPQPKQKRPRKTDLIRDFIAQTDLFNLAIVKKGVQTANPWLGELNKTSVASALANMCEWGWIVEVPGKHEGRGRYYRKTEKWNKEVHNA